MTRPPLIGIPGRRTKAANVVDWPAVLDELDVDLYLAGYAQGILEAGGLPFHIPVAVDPAAIAPHLDGLLLTGGADIDPARYGAEPHPDLTPLQLERDVLEFGLIRAAIELDIPVLGVCRGLQVINVACNGTLNQHLPEHWRADVPFTETVHEVVTEEGSCLRELYGRSVAVNSLHHQAVDRLGDGLRITARAEDGCIEGLEMGDRVIAVQWHPEMLLTRPHDPALRWLVERAAQ